MVSATSSFTSLPVQLRQALESGECVLFIGAGIGGYVVDSAGQPLPTASALAIEIADFFQIDAGESTDLSKISAVVEIRKHGRKELTAFIQKRLANVTPNADIQWLATRPWRAIFTTNYDNALERAYALNPTPLQSPVIATVTAELGPMNPMIEVPIYHLHGALFGLHEPRIIVTENDYNIFRERRRMLFDIFKKELITSTILYVGYSHNDSNWKLILDELVGDMGEGVRPLSYRIAPTTPALDREILRHKGVQTLDCDLHQFLQVAQLELAAPPTTIDLLKPLAINVPSDLRGIFDQTPTAVIRLLKSWNYVNQVPAQKSNLARFLKGDKANWGLIFERDFFERDIEEEIYTDLIDYATRLTPKPIVRAIIGPAGFGMSTLLLSLAGRLVSERAGPVFMLKDGVSLSEGDILFAASIFQEQRAFFIVDNGADHATEILDSTYRLNDADRTAMFLVAERANEWHQSRGKLKALEYTLEALSDPEIIRLIDFLGRHGELGVMEGLTPELRFAAIKNKHGKQLLVAMREAIEDNQFDAILEDEYNNIGNGLSKQLYLIVCCFSQHGALLRDSLLAELLDVNLATMYPLTNEALEGVVIYDDLDTSAGTYVARARHHTIAAIVWERCGDILDKETLLLKAIKCLNINYKADADAFEQFIRSTRLVDSIRSLDGRMQFFDTAIQKNPEGPYVRQHYARMLNRADKAELALLQIEKAIELGPDIRVLFHTKGLILSKLAIGSESVELSRRRFLQAEQAFRQALSSNERDEYSYTSLADLYLDWGKKIPNEAAAYLQKAEETISEGLKVVRNKEFLWVASSNLQDWLGNQPQRIGDLEHAIKDHPGAVYPRYLLAQAYRRAGRPDLAIEKLDPVLKDHPEEFRLCLEYAYALDETGAKYSAAIAILNFGSLYGLRDPRFIATYGGMYFMNGDFGEADKIFQETTRREINFSDAVAINYRPKNKQNLSELVSLEGEVVQVKAGYAFVEVPGFTRFLCPSSKQRNITLRERMRIRFQPAFSAKGALADKPEELHSHS